MIFNDNFFLNNLSTKIYRKDTFGNYRTSSYKLNYMETPTGLKIVLNTDLNVGKLDDILHNIYKVCIKMGGIVL